MRKRHLKLLLIDDNEQDYTFTRDLLAALDAWRFNLEWVATLQAALEKMKREQFDLCLLGCRLDERHGLKFLNQIGENGLVTPLILLIQPEDRDAAAAAMETNAMIDCLVKGQINPELLERSIRQGVRCKQVAESVEKQTKAQANEQLQRDLSDCNQALQTLRESERRYRLSFELSADGIEILDTQGKIVDCNATYQELVGSSREEIIGQPASAFAPDNGGGPFAKPVMPLVKEKEIVEGEFELTRQDGSTRLVWRRSQALYDDAGAFTGVVVYSRDITDRLQAVEQLSQLALAMEQNPLAIMITDITGKIEYVNFKFSELTGCNYEDAVRQNLRAFKAAQQSSEDYAAMWDQITAGAEWYGEFPNQTQDGETYWEAVTIAPMFDIEEAITHFIVVKEDISARKQAEEAALSSQQRLGGLATEHIGDLTALNEQLQREISERKRTEQALEETKARLQGQYKGIPVPTYSWQRIDNDFVLVDYNDAAEKFGQGNAADLLGKTVGQIFRDRPQVLADFAQCFAERTTVKREAPYELLATDETRYFVTTYNFIPPNLIVDHIQDITEYKQAEADLKQRHQELEALAAKHRAAVEKANEALQQEITRREQAEQALRESEERLKEVVNNIDERLREQYRRIPLPTYSWQRIAAEFVLVDYNAAAEQAMGRIVDFVGKPASEIFKDRPQVLADFERCFAEQKTVRREAPYELITSGETRHHVTTYVFAPPNLVIDYIQDITEYKEIEAELERYRAQLDEAATDPGLELAKAREALEQQITERERLEETLHHLEAELRKYQRQLEALVKEETAELTKMCERLQEELEQELAKYEHARTSLRAARARLKAQYNGIPIPTYSWRRVRDSFVLVGYNQAAEKSTRGSIAQFRGKTANEVFKDRPQVLADFARCYDEKTIVRREALYRLVTTGETRYFVTTYNFVQPDLIIVHIQDVTEQKRMEEALQECEEKVDLVCRFSPEATLTFVNDAYCWYFNQEREQLVGRLMPFVLDEDQEKVKAHLASLSQENPIGAIAYRMFKPNGAVRWHQWINRAIFDQRGQPIEIRSMGRDITSRKRAAR